MKYHPFAFWLAALIAGILLANNYYVDKIWLIVISALCLVFYMVLLIMQVKTNLLFIIGMVFMVNVGAWRYQQTNRLPITSLPDTAQLVNIKVDQLLKPSPKFNKYYATMVAIDSSTHLQGQRILVYIRKENTGLHQGDNAWILGKITAISEPKNPYVFNYKKYMAHKRIHYQVFSDTLVSLSHGRTWQHRLSEFKESTKDKLALAGFSNTSQIFISSLALGDRMNLDKDFQETLSSAGVMHLFAISGLHVAIVFGFVLLLFYPLLYLPRGKILRWVVALIVIWIFAWFVDFTSSVTRAVFMISVYYITLILQRTTNIYHTLALTAFVLLLMDPNELFQVGFQLSYSAVFFIAWLYRPFRNLLPHFRKPYKNYLFDVMALSTTAQMGVMPISVYYFHKFSLLFLIGNLAVIPFAGLMVVTSLITTFTIHTGCLPAFWVEGTNKAFAFIQFFLDYLTNYDGFILRGISWSPIQVLLLIVLLLLVRRVLIKFKWRKLIPILFVLLLLQITRFWEIKQSQDKTELIVFNQYKHTMIGIRHGRILDIFWDVKDSVSVSRYVIEPYVLNEKINEVRSHNLLDNHRAHKFIKKRRLIKINHETYYIADANTKAIPVVDYVIITQSPKGIQDSIPSKIKRIIADGSNYPYIINRLSKKSNSVYSTAVDGAFIKTY